MIHRGFRNAEESHAHSLQTLSMLGQYADFLESVGTVADMGCGDGLDLEWWATRTTQEDTPRPLNIKCTGVDLRPELSIAHRYPNIQYQNTDFERPIPIHKRRFDVIWCHDAFQYVLDPFTTLTNWREVISNNGMLVLILPQTTELETHHQAYDQPDFHYYNWTMVSLIHVLAVTGWDCADGFFKKDPTDPWLHAVVYKGQNQPRDPRTTRWYDLAEAGALPKSAAESVNKYGYLRQRDLVLPWLDRSLRWFGQN
jgi:SAM-dependent methyltransferase